MSQTLAVWLVILLSLVTANLPFLLQSPLLALPWKQQGEPLRPAWLRILESITFFAALFALGVFFYSFIGNSIVFASDATSIFIFYGKVVAYLLSVGLLLFYVGYRSRNRSIKKSVFERFIELFVLYLLCGVLGFAFELNQGNRFPQTWEFFAITGSLYAVLGFPGFVIRFLMRKRRKPYS